MNIKRQAFLVEKLLFLSPLECGLYLVAYFHSIEDVKRKRKGRIIQVETPGK